ncbi:MAG: hypothetical protein ACMXYF_00160 [Candidatus Woesearchaeota archaeon]
MRYSIQRSKVDQEKKRQKRLVVVAILIIVMMLFSIFAYVGFYVVDGGVGGAQTIQDSGLTFRSGMMGDQFVYQAQINREQYLFSLLPSELEAYPVPAEVRARLAQESAFILALQPELLTDPQVQLSIGLFDQSMGQIVVDYALTNQSDIFDEQIPIVTCQDTEQFVVQLQQGPENGFFLDGDCLTIQAISSFDVRYLFHALSYTHLGVLPYEQ